MQRPPAHKDTKKAVLSEKGADFDLAWLLTSLLGYHEQSRGGGREH